MSEWIISAGPGQAEKLTVESAGSTPGKEATFSVSQRPVKSTAETSIPVVTGKVLVTAVSIYCVFVAIIFYDTLLSLIMIWLRSQTFAHGFLILPISLWLTWRMRDCFSGLNVRPQPWALLLVLGAGLAWLLAHLVDVQVIKHLSFITILVCGIWAIVGNQVARSYAFPLGFLYLAVPMGAGLIPPLMEFTADTTEYLLRLSGIPVFREGMYLTLPTGLWSVIEECSGVRYLIASVTLGLCYAHLTYNSLWRKIAFMTVAIILPILANSVRAYAVVMTGHLSNMRFGVGADHLVYGWIFFGLVLLLMFWIGSFWQEHEPSTGVIPKPAQPPCRKSGWSLSLGTCLALFCASIWPTLALSMNRYVEPPATLALTLPETLGNWQAVELPGWRWRPGQEGADRVLDQVYTSNSNPASHVGLHMRQYLRQQQGAELVTTTDPWRPDRKDWRVIWQQQALVNMGRSVEVDEARVVSARDNLLVWSWYHIDSRNTSNPYIVKLLEAKQQIVAGRRQGTRVFIATPMGEDIGPAREVLQNFITATQSTINISLDTGINDYRIVESMSTEGEP